jgi:hypothetical protein
MEGRKQTKRDERKLREKEKGRNRKTEHNIEEISLCFYPR